jgi:hypothetical protein
MEQIQNDLKDLPTEKESLYIRARVRMMQNSDEELLHYANNFPERFCLKRQLLEIIRTVEMCIEVRMKASEKQVLKG